MTKKWTLKDGVLVPATPGLAVPQHMEVERDAEQQPGVMDVPAGSAEGQQALSELMADIRKQTPGTAKRASYDGVAEKQLTRDVKITLRVTPVAWGVPFDELTYTRWIVNFWGFRTMPWDDFITASSTYLPDARNIIHGRFVNESHAPYLVMLDSDVMPPPDFLERCLKSMEDDEDIKMIGGWYRKKGEPYVPCVYEFAKMDEDTGIPLYHEFLQPGEGVQAVDGAGAGCWVMAREVALAIGEAPYNMNEGGEDLLLCRKVHEAGYKTYIDWSIACAHAGVAYV